MKIKKAFFAFACLLVIIASFLVLPKLAIASGYFGEYLFGTDGNYHAASLRIESDKKILKRFKRQTVSISVDTQNDTINAVQAVINFDPRKVRVDEINIEKTFCNHGLFLEKSKDNNLGEVRVACGLFNPGFSGDGVVVELELTPLRRGDFSLNFSPECMVLANDGLGTEVLSFVYNGVFRAN